MRRPAALPLLFLLLFLLSALPALPALSGELENVGSVSRARGLSYAVQDGALRELAPGALIGRKDVLKTGPGARLELLLLDETQLTLGENAVLSVERYDLGRKEGSALLRLSKGVFRAVTSRLEGVRGGGLEIVTPLATIGIRGTDFWGGLDEKDGLSVLLISGKGVYVFNDGGRTEITRPFEGVSVRSPSAPPPSPSLWSPERRQRALKTVAFD